MEYWSDERLQCSLLRLVRFFLLNRFYLFLLVDLTSVPKSRRDPELGQDVGLKSDPDNDNKNQP